MVFLLIRPKRTWPKSKISTVIPVVINMCSFRVRKKIICRTKESKNTTTQYSGWLKSINTYSSKDRNAIFPLIHSERAQTASSGGQFRYKESVIVTDYIQIFFTQQSMNENLSASHGHVTHRLRVGVKEIHKDIKPKRQAVLPREETDSNCMSALVRIMQLSFHPSCWETSSLTE